MYQNPYCQWKRHDHHVLFQRWASEVNSKFVSAGGYTIDESDEAITIAQRQCKARLKQGGLAKSVLTALESEGWDEIK